MELKTEKIIAYYVAAALFLVGVVCYAAFPEKKPEEPIRIMLKSTAGKVLFTHKVHTSEDDYGFDCTDCHHLYEKEEGVKPEACGECHLEESEEEEPKRSDAFHQQCIGCHEDDGTGPADCSACHVL
ncbi:cytochrome c3 family protein [Thermodesulfobacteriota bacterium]